MSINRILNVKQISERSSYASVIFDLFSCRHVMQLKALV